MSFRNGHANGAYGRNPYEDSSTDGDSRGGSRQRRPGGYGGLYDTDSPAPTPPEQTPPPSFRRQRLGDPAGGTSLFAPSRRDQDGYESSRSRDRSFRTREEPKRYIGGPSGDQIDLVLDHIQDSWTVLTTPECTPVQVALQLMDYSSLGRGNDYQDFQKTNRNLQKSLKTIVNEHHQGFNSSIGTFHKIQASIQTSQNRVRDLKSSIGGAKQNLMVTKPELKNMVGSSQKYEEMLQVLAHIEKLQVVPEQLDARISEKRFLSAVEYLQDALRVIRRSEMENIGALTDLRIYFGNQETSMVDILIEELHDHLYLKSPYTHDRWKPYGTNVGNASKSEVGAAALPNTWGRPLYRFLDNLNTSKALEEDASKNPEADSFEYMHLIMEALNKLGQLDAVVDRMEERLPVELFNIVDRTNQEVEIRHTSYVRGLRVSEKGRLALDIDQSSQGREVLKDLLWTLYSKFEAIAEGHRAINDVVVGIVKREGLRQPQQLTRGFKEMWKLFQSEMRSLLHDYLATDGNQAYRLGGKQAGENNFFRLGPREKTKKVFKLGQLDPKSADLAVDQKDLDSILQASVPGLVSKNQRHSATNPNTVTTTPDRPAAGHKLLVDPNVFNIGSLLPPSLVFLQRLRDIVPQNSEIAVSTLTSFLDEFIVNVFHPQLEDTVTELCTHSFAETEAFQELSHWQLNAPKPIFKGTFVFFSLIKSFCQLLDTIPPDLTSTQLIITQIIAYYDRCCDWFKALVKRPQMQAQDETHLKPAAIMAESLETRQLLESILENNNVSEGEGSPLSKECAILVTKTNQEPLDSLDIIADRRSVASLCMLCSSMEWLATQLQSLRRLVPEKMSQKPSQNRQWSILANPAPTTTTNPVYLPMSSETIDAFDQILTSIRTLATTALFTLHLDIRYGVIHMLTRMLASPYLLSELAQDPDASILQLNTELKSFADTLSSHLPVRLQIFITSGLAELIDTFLVSNASHIQHGMNEHGCRRMQLNILVLSQNLKSIENSYEGRTVELDRSDRFYELFSEGAARVVSRAKDHGGEGLEGFDLEELKALVELWHKEGTESTQREIQVKSKRDLADNLLVLSECLWNR